MATENEGGRRPGVLRRSHGARRVNERASRARQLTDREAQAWQLKAAGYTHAEIGRLLVAEGDNPLTLTTVANILAAAEAKIGFHSTAQAVASVRSQQLEQLEHVYSEAMAAWRKSKQAKKSASKRTSRGVALGQHGVLATTAHKAVAQTATEEVAELEAKLKQMDRA
jgi:hypothetical protein